MWRGRRTDRLTTEDCISFDTSELKRAGVFRSALGTFCTTKWPDQSGKQGLGLTFWILPRSDGRLTLCVIYGQINLLTDPRSAQHETIELDRTHCHFGGLRYWFLCPRLQGGFPCRRRVRVLYLPPGSSLFGCRTCFNLTYRSCQEHDKRVDALLKLSPGEFRRTLAGNDLRRSLLAVNAQTLLLRRLVRKASRGRFGPPRAGNSTIK
jgi:hypothetical protein